MIEIDDCAYAAYTAYHSCGLSMYDVSFTCRGTVCRLHKNDTVLSKWHIQYMSPTQAFIASMHHSLAVLEQQYAATQT